MTMPYGLPSATVCIRSVDVDKFDLDLTPRGEIKLLYGTHLTILHPGADQDGFNGEVICSASDKPDVLLAVPPFYLRLS